MGLGKLCKSLFRRVDTGCQHLRGTETKWLDKDGTPMMSFSCPDCGFYDTGHVHVANPSQWLTEDDEQ